MNRLSSLSLPYQQNENVSVWNHIHRESVSRLTSIAYTNVRHTSSYEDIGKVSPLSTTSMFVFSTTYVQEACYIYGPSSNSIEFHAILSHRCAFPLSSLALALSTETRATTFGSAIRKLLSFQLLFFLRSTELDHTSQE